MRCRVCGSLLYVALCHFLDLFNTEFCKEKMKTSCVGPLNDVELDGACLLIEYVLDAFSFILFCTTITP